MPEKSETRTFATSLDDVRSAAEDALASLGATVDVADGGTSVSGKTGWSAMSFFGERVEIHLGERGDDVEVTVASRQSRGQFLDLGRRNEKNVAHVMSVLEARLRA